MKHLSYILLAIWSSSLLICERLEAVVVDGGKKADMSATKNQSDEKSSIDAFNTKICGMSDSNNLEHEFVNMAREGQFPWIVSFQIQIPSDSSAKLELKKENALNKGEKLDENTNKTLTEQAKNKKEKDLHFCSGSLISDKWIISAAHCFTSKTIKKYLDTGKLKVVAGSHKVSSRSPMNRNLTIKRIFYHGQFEESAKIGFDIALVELVDRVNLTNKLVKSDLDEQSKPFMNTICLPLKDKKYKFNETARIAGWGLSSAKDESSMPSKLLTTDILVNKLDDCVDIYGKQLKSDRPKQQHDKYDDFICASYKNSRDACQYSISNLTESSPTLADSGGPLMQFAGGKAVVIGVVSFGIGCATKGVPGLYTRLSAYINWIKDITHNGKESSVRFEVLESNSQVEENGNNNSTDSEDASSDDKIEQTTTTTIAPHSSTTAKVAIKSRPKPLKVTNNKTDNITDETWGFQPSGSGFTFNGAPKFKYFDQ